MAMSTFAFYGTCGYGRKISISRNNNGITIFMYDDFRSDNTTSTPNCLEIKDYETSYTVEQLCQKTASHLGIGTVAFPLFAMFDMGRDVWLAPNILVHCSISESRLLVFRARFMPSPKAIVNVLFVDDMNAAKYLFLQMRHDFLNDLVTYNKEKKVSNEHLLGLVVFDLVRYGKEKNLELKHIENLALKHFIPSSSKDHYKYLWDRKRLQSNIKPYLQKHFEKEKECTAAKPMKAFILGLRGYMESYGAETFDIGTGHQVCIDPYRGDGKPAIYNIITDKSGIKEEIDFSDIEALVSLSTPARHDNTVAVMLHSRDDRPPEQFEFLTKEVAVSFIALLDGYHRMLEDYHHTLCPSVVKSPELDILRQIGCHGPVTREWAKDRLRQRHSEDVAYNFLLKLRSSDHKMLILSYINSTNHIDFYIIKTFHQDTEVMFGINLEGEPNFHSVPELLLHYKSDRHPKIKLKKGVRPTDPLDKRLYLCREEMIQNTIASPVKRSRQRKADVCLVSGVYLEGTSIGTGEFTEVYKGKWEKESSIQTVAIKRLRMEDSHGIIEFTKAIHKAAFWCHATIATVHALCLAPTFCMLMEYAELGPLDKYLIRKKSDLNIYSLIMVAEQLAQALFYMETRQPSYEEEGNYHGNIRTRNILVFEQKDELLRIKLSDPGMIYANNKLELKAPQNAERLPWIAPELYTDLTRMTKYSDRYAYGITLWEILSEGDRPFMYMDFREIIKYVKTDKHMLEKPHDNCPATMYTMMKRCWSPIPHARISAKEIVRDICNFLQSDYRVNDYELAPTDSSANSFMGANANQGSDLASNNMLDEDSAVVENGSSGASSGNPTHSSLPLSNSTMSCDSTTPLMPDGLVSSGDVFGSMGSDISQLTASTNLHDYDCQDQSLNLGSTTQSPGTEVLGRLKRPLPETPEMPKPVEPLPHERVKIDFNCTALGEGHFGEVFKGYFITNHGNPRPVAIKKLKSDMFNEYGSEFEKEFQIMIKLNHCRIVEIIGHCPQKDVSRPMWLVMEFVENGSLYKFLHKHKSNLRKHTMIQFGCEIAEGMEYLCEKNILHRDLAARNVLVTKEDHMKITDFGLARVMPGEKNYYKLTPSKECPVYWTAPEALNLKYTVLSDVWSYGITLWEIFSYGDAPKYPNLDDVCGLSQTLNDGIRLEKPRACPHDIYNKVIMQCWYYKPEERKNFKKLREILQKYEQNYAGSSE